MKKFLVFIGALAVCLIGIYSAVFYGGFYLDLQPDKSVEVMVKTDKKTIFVLNQDGNFEPFQIKGVNLPSSIPGHPSSDFAIDKDTWLRWFSLIQEMGANTIRIYTIYDDAFYDALYQFNTAQREPLYLLQGLQVSDHANHSKADAYGSEFYTALKQDSLDAIDVVHGRKNILLNSRKGSGSYRRDISPWVLGYVLGNEWKAGTVAYTNHNRKNLSSYTGTYFFTSEEATAFEAMLARILDEMVIYESGKYKTQRLLSFQNDPENDPLVYAETYAKQLGKFSNTDAEHLKTTDKLKSGYFAAYRLYEYCPDFAQYLSREQRDKITNILSHLDTSLYNQGYTQLLSEYHTMPVVITGYGFSSSRGTDTMDGPLTELQQGKRLLSVYEDIIASGCSGAFIDSWQDVWERRTWNTSYAVDVDHAYCWHDIQTDGQGYGLLAFDPGREKSECYVDGDSSEWEPNERMLEQADLTLSVKYDERCLYILVEQDGLKAERELYVPIDLTPESGSEVSDFPAVSFERAADFLLCINGQPGSRLLVHSRYEALRENYLMQTEGRDPFVTFPGKNDPKFVPVQMILQNHSMVAEGDSDVAAKAARRSKVFETGALIQGNGNPSSAQYNSLSDFCYGDDCVEIRIPWQMLNFSNPSGMKIHDDYYKHYGVEELSVKEMYLGVGTPGEGKILMQPFSLKGWGEKIEYHERLKQSYEVIKKGWGNQDAS